jgi:uncharacterized protein (DUF1330 family)
MTAYAFFEVTLTKSPSPAALAAYDSYRAAVPDLVAQHGGRYLARAWPGRALEGDPAGDRFHLVEFPDEASATALWTSPGYLAIKHRRGGAAEVRAILISGQGQP